MRRSYQRNYAKEALVRLPAGSDFSLNSLNFSNSFPL
jgi:hypothetical protein